MSNTSPSLPKSRPLSKHAIFVIHAGAIGDLLLTRPALKALRHSYPQSLVVACGYPERLKLLQEDCHLNSVISLDNLPLAPLFEKNLIPEKAPLPYLSHFDLIISWFGAGSQEFRENLNHLGPKREIVVASSRPPIDWNRHASEYYRETLQPLGIRETVNCFDNLALAERDVSLDFAAEGKIVTLDRGDFSRPWEAKASPTQTLHQGGGDSARKEPCFPFPPCGARSGGGGFSDQIVAIHPGSGSRLKNWPTSRFVLLAQCLQKELRATILLICGPADQESCRQFQQNFKGEPLVIINSPPLPSLPWLMQKCSLFIGNDSGITHLAAALGIPTVAIYGPTDPKIWKPLGKKVVVISNTAMVLTSQQGYKNDPGWQDSGTQIQNTGGLAGISVGEVLEAIKALM